MSKMVYTVTPADDGWAIVQEANRYTGYKTDATAIKSAIAVASKLGLSGHETFVMLQSPDGSLKQVFASDPAPPTIDSMMDEVR
ncbi:hypothetical protein EAH89_18240 [Roseomonas nepalensis]|uniref:DUF2188 domain-containing protein n=1 Tax=Muricoccus nepalensis TaxID=1854500 RepID=A0A502FSV3_9PROT|nr:hypothetical protein [Roseomonas nepalensis]TPG52501.1 hypothetical protein EAH89_18240 [Roseomonas nepalensis]